MFFLGGYFYQKTKSVNLLPTVIKMREIEPSYET